MKKTERKFRLGDQLWPLFEAKYKTFEERKAAPCYSVYRDRLSAKSHPHPNTLRKIAADLGVEVKFKMLIIPNN